MPSLAVVLVSPLEGDNKISAAVQHLDPYAILA